VDVKKDPSRLDEMLRYSQGKRNVPTIVEGDRVTVGYGGS
jgi:glutaredoxin